jgi:hypothetical protein
MFVSFLWFGIIGIVANPNGWILDGSSTKFAAILESDEVLLLLYPCSFEP